ncbi:MAG: hypothetical protein NZ108_09340, partial [Bacteroidia bacterium]|nr:hypothetical protein [Bacteroidia bacterium]
MGHGHHQVSYNLDEKFTITPRIQSAINRFFIFGGVLLVLGIIFAIIFPDHHDAHTAGHHAHHSSALLRRIFASLLQNGFMFMSVGLLATFFIAIQSVANAGWATTFRRVPEAFGHFLPIAYGFIILFFIGAFATHSLHDFYHWTDAETVAKDELLKAKSGYLNIPFFLGRALLFFAIWFFLFKALRDLSLKEDQIGGLESFDKAKVYACIYIAVFALSYSAASWDWIMSLEAHWFSTMFGVY